MMTLSNRREYASISPLGNLTMVRPKLLSTKGVKQMLHGTLFGECISHILNFPKQKKAKEKSSEVGSQITKYVAMFLSLFNLRKPCIQKASNCYKCIF